MSDNNSNNTPNSHQGAVNQALNDAARGNQPANTSQWDAAQRDAYLATYNNQKKD